MYWIAREKGCWASAGTSADRYESSLHLAFSQHSNRSTRHSAMCKLDNSLDISPVTHLSLCPTFRTRHCQICQVQSWLEANNSKNTSAHHEESWNMLGSFEQNLDSELLCPEYCLSSLKMLKFVAPKPGIFSKVITKNIIISSSSRFLPRSSKCPKIRRKRIKDTLCLIPRSWAKIEDAAESWWLQLTPFPQKHAFVCQ